MSNVRMVARALRRFRTGPVTALLLILLIPGGIEYEPHRPTVGFPSAPLLTSATTPEVEGGESHLAKPRPAESRPTYPRAMISPPNAEVSSDIARTPDSGIDLAAAWATIIAALLAGCGLLATAYQLRVQNRLARLQQLTVVDESWRRWRDQTDPGNKTVSLRAASIVATQVYENFPAEVSPCPPPPGADADAREAPWIMDVFLPAMASSTVSPPENEAAYQALLRHRSRLVATTLDAFERTDDFGAFGKVISAYLNHLNDLAEKYESGVIDRDVFLSKFHANIVRAAFHYEPFVLWANSREPNPRQFMRTLAIASAARQYHWTSRLQDDAVSSRRELGPIITAGRFARPHGLRASLPTLRAYRIKQPFSQAARRQSRELVRALRADFGGPARTCPPELLRESIKALLG